MPAEDYPVSDLATDHFTDITHPAGHVVVGAQLTIND